MGWPPPFSLKVQGAHKATLDVGVGLDVRPPGKRESGGEDTKHTNSAPDFNADVGQKIP